MLFGQLFDDLCQEHNVGQMQKDVATRTMGPPAGNDFRRFKVFEAEIVSHRLITEDERNLYKTVDGVHYLVVFKQVQDQMMLLQFVSYRNGNGAALYQPRARYVMLYATIRQESELVREPRKRKGRKGKVDT